MQAIRENQVSLFLQEQAAIKAVQLRKIELMPTANKRVYDPKALEFIVCTKIFYDNRNGLKRKDMRIVMSQKTRWFCF